MDKAREETGESETGEPIDQRSRGILTRASIRQEKEKKCIVDSCTEDHSPWVCKAFKGLSVQRRKELITQTCRCFRCLAACHQSRDCHNALQCGVDGCISNRRSSYLHEYESLKVNIMLDPCSTGSYLSEAATEELNLRGQPQTLRIAGTGGADVTKRSSRVELTFSNIETDFSAKLEANVLTNITSDTPTIQWLELKNKWPHLRLIPFQ